MNEGGISLHKTISEINLVYKGLMGLEYEGSSEVAGKLK